MDVAVWLRKQLEEASPDLLGAMVKYFAEALMGAEAEALCGAGYGERTPERVNRCNGYRERDWDTRVGSIELAVPKLCEGSCFPDWLLQPRRRARPGSVAARTSCATLLTRVPKSAQSFVATMVRTIFRAARCRHRPRAARPDRRPTRTALPGGRGAAQRSRH
jgi:hypothetical protein